jgi:hypothetical protein
LAIAYVAGPTTVSPPERQTQERSRRSWRHSRSGTEEIDRNILPLNKSCLEKKTKFWTQNYIWKRKHSKGEETELRRWSKSITDHCKIAVKMYDNVNRKTNGYEGELKMFKVSGWRKRFKDGFSAKTYHPKTSPSFPLRKVQYLEGSGLSLARNIRDASHIAKKRRSDKRFQDHSEKSHLRVDMVTNLGIAISLDIVTNLRHLPRGQVQGLTLRNRREVLSYGLGATNAKSRRMKVRTSKKRRVEQEKCDHAQCRKILRCREEMEYRKLDLSSSTSFSFPSPPFALARPP